MKHVHGVGAALALLLVACAPAQAAPSKATCHSAAHRQFDFFAGDWDAYDLAAQSQRVARNKVTIILDGCVIFEDYRQNDGLHGKSYSLYDAARGVWHQSWVTNRGDLLLLDGRLQDGKMTFEGQHRTAAGKPEQLRVVWIPAGRNVRETATRSLDGGKSWQPMFDILFKPHR